MKTENKEPTKLTHYGIKYIGDRKKHFDNLYGTNLEWAPGQVHNVSVAAGNEMLKHGDVYEIAESVSGTAISEGHEKVAEDIQKVPPFLPNFQGMNKLELQSYAQQHYGENISDKMTEAKVRAKIMTMVQSRGVK
jgi:hypothetical protein